MLRFILAAGCAALASTAQACAMPPGRMPPLLAALDSDLVVVGRVRDMVIFDRAQGGRLAGTARFAIEVTDVLLGEAPAPLLVTWFPGTNNGPYPLPDRPLVFALYAPDGAAIDASRRRDWARLDDLEIWPNGLDPGRYSPLQPVCDWPFILRDGEGGAVALREVLDGEGDAEAEAEVLQPMVSGVELGLDDCSEDTSWRESGQPVAFCERRPPQPETLIRALETRDRLLREAGLP